MSNVLERAGALKIYHELDKVACCNCKNAIWQKINDSLRCHCNIFAEITFQCCRREGFKQTLTGITDCDGFEQIDDVSTAVTKDTSIKPAPSPIGKILDSIPVDGDAADKRTG